MTMAGPEERAEELSLLRRWRLLARPVGALGAAETALLLSSYAEDRLDEAGAETIETWLVDHPEAIGDLIAARSADEGAAPAASEAMVARAAALVAASDGNVVRFPAGGVPMRRSWRAAAAWSGLAASLLVTSLVGFALGDNAYSNLAAKGASAESAIHELLDPPAGLFAVEDEDSAT